MIGLGTAARIAAGQLRQTQLIDDFDDVPGEVIFGQPFIHRRRQQVVLVTVVLDESGHGFS